MKVKIIKTLKCKKCHQDFDVAITGLFTEAAMVSLISSNKLNSKRGVRADLECPHCHLANGVILMEIDFPFKTLPDISVSFLAIERHLQTELINQLKQYGFVSEEQKE